MFALIFAIMIVEVLITLGISRAFGIHLGSSVVAGMGLPNVIIAGVLADQIFKRMGLSRSGTTVEGRKPTTVTPEGEVGDDEVVEIFYRRSFYLGLGVACLLICMLCSSVPLLNRGVMNSNSWMAGSLGLFFGFGAIYAFYLLLRGIPQVRADSSGILADSKRWPTTKKFVPWSSVATCEIITHYDTFGDRMSTVPILKGTDGQELLIPELSFTRPEDQDRLIAYIRAKLPKLHEDPWDWE